MRHLLAKTLFRCGYALLGVYANDVEGVAVSPDSSVLIAGTVSDNVTLGTVSFTPHTFVVSLPP